MRGRLSSAGARFPTTCSPPVTGTALYAKWPRTFSRTIGLPGMPSAEEAEKSGLSVGEMQKKMLEKIEELTLHMIDADERSRQLEKENRDLRERLAKVEAREK